jgi:zinc transport system ATP-binding protein
MNSLSVSGLSFGYGREEILSNISLELPERSFLVVIGPNGGGKSTFLKLILGLLRAESASIKIFDKPVEKMLHLVGYVPQDDDRIKNFPINVLDTVIMGFYNSKRNKKEIRRLSEEAIDTFGMSQYKNHRLNELSTGQRQRIFLARAVAPAPKLLALDEPISGIDPAGQQIVLQTLHERLPDSTIIFISHDLSVIPGNATCVACVNRTLYYHPKGELTESLISQAYGDVGAMKLVSHNCNCDVPHD